jgi:hypothetical protein
VRKSRLAWIPLAAFFVLPLLIAGTLLGFALFGPERGPGPVARRVLASGVVTGWKAPRSVGSFGFEALDDPTQAGWWQYGAASIDRGRWALELSARPEVAPLDRLALLEEAVGALKLGLARSPTTTYGWSYLVMAMARSAAPGPELAEVWKMSILIAPVAHELAPWRVDWGLRIYPYLDEEARGLLGQQVELGWSKDAAALARSALREDRLDLLREVLTRYDPEASGKLDEVVKRVRG